MNVFEFALTLLVALAVTAVVFVLTDRLSPMHKFAALSENISQRTADHVFMILSLGYVLVFGSLAILRHESFHSGGYDLGIFDQVAWNSLRGRLFENSIMIDSPSWVTTFHRSSPVLSRFMRCGVTRACC